MIRVRINALVCVTAFLIGFLILLLKIWRLYSQRFQIDTYFIHFCHHDTGDKVEQTRKPRGWSDPGSTL